MSTNPSESESWAIKFPMKVYDYSDSWFCINKTTEYHEGHTNIPIVREYAEKKIAEYEKDNADVEKGWAVSKGLESADLAERQDHWKVVTTKDGWLTKNCKWN